MFNSQNKVQANQPESKVKLEPYEIRVMPPKFHQYLQVKKSGLTKWLLLGLVAVALLVAIGLGIYYFLQFQKSQNLNEPVIPAINQNINTVANINQPEINTNTDEVNANTNVNAEVNANANANTNTNETNINLNSNINTAPAEISYFSSQDADNDSLTDVEEDLYTTEKRKPDTDNDGYIDGQEIINNFNPKAAGAAYLSNSGLVNTYINPNYNYEVLYLKDWLARPTSESTAEVVFQSATGEYIQITVEENSNGQDLVEWFVAKNSLADVGTLQRQTLKSGLEALISADKLTYYLIETEKKDRVYIISYNIGNKTSVNFLTTFSMMINSFKLRAATVAPEFSPTPATGQ